MDVDFKKRFQQANQGKKLFFQKFEVEKLSINDTFLLVLTDNSDCIYYGVKYLPDFIEFHNKRNVYVLLSDLQYENSFSKAGGIVKKCKYEEMQTLYFYLNVFHKKNRIDTRIIFLTEKNGYGLAIEELLKKEEFTLEEYIAISLYYLKELKKESVIGFGSTRQIGKKKDQRTFGQ